MSSELSLSSFVTWASCDLESVRQPRTLISYGNSMDISFNSVIHHSTSKSRLFSRQKSMMVQHFWGLSPIFANSLCETSGRGLCSLNMCRILWTAVGLARFTPFQGLVRESHHMVGPTEDSFSETRLQAGEGHRGRGGPVELLPLDGSPLLAKLSSSENASDSSSSSWWLFRRGHTLNTLTFVHVFQYRRRCGCCGYKGLNWICVGIAGASWHAFRSLRLHSMEIHPGMSLVTPVSTAQCICLSVIVACPRS